MMTNVQTHDVNGREYACLSDVVVGSKLCTDDGFDCRRPYQVSTVEADENGKYLPCDEGKHYLDGQLQDDGDTMVGVYWAPQPAT